MAYSDFTLQKLKKDFGLQVDEQPNLFASVEPITSSDLLNTTLQETVQLAIAINTEKARSEMIITPVLLEVRRRANGQVPYRIDYDKLINIKVFSKQTVIHSGERLK